MEKRANIILLSILGAMMLAVFFRFFSLLSFPDSSVVLEKGELIPLPTKQSLSQVFVANRDNLTKIEYLFRTPGPKPGDTVSVELRDASCTDTIRTGSIVPSFLNSDNLYEVAFPAIPDSNGQIYCLVTSYKPKDANIKGLRLFSMETADTRLILRNIATGETFDGKTLAIRGVYRNASVWQDLGELNHRISQYKPWFLKDAFVGTVAVLFVVLSVGLVAVLIA